MKPIKISMRRDQIRCLLQMAQTAQAMITYECKPDTCNYAKGLAGKLSTERIEEIIPILEGALDA